MGGSKETTLTASQYTSLSDLYGFGQNEDKSQKSEYEQKRLKLKLKNRDSNIFKPDALGIARLDNNVYRDFVIADSEKRDWWISTNYYDEQKDQMAKTNACSEPDPQCAVI